MDELKKIKQVEAPPYLFTRIKQQIQNIGKEEAPVNWKWAFVSSSVLLLALNISILMNNTDRNSQTTVEGANIGIEQVVSSMNLSTRNNLYNE